MNLPNLLILAQQQATFVRYQDGKLWYRVQWSNPDDTSFDGTRIFEFPIPTDAPELLETCKEVSQALLVGLYEAKYLREALDREIVAHEKTVAGGGEFLAQDKGIRFLRWIRPHLEMLRAAQDAVSEPSA